MMTVVDDLKKTIVHRHCHTYYQMTANWRGGTRVLQNKTYTHEGEPVCTVAQPFRSLSCLALLVVCHFIVELFSLLLSNMFMVNTVYGVV